MLLCFSVVSSVRWFAVRGDHGRRFAATNRPLPIVRGSGGRDPSGRERRDRSP